MFESHKGTVSKLMLGASVVAIVTVLGAPSVFAADAGVETVVVTGFRASLDHAYPVVTHSHYA